MQNDEPRRFRALGLGSSRGFDKGLRAFLRFLWVFGGAQGFALRMPGLGFRVTILPGFRFGIRVC